MRVHGEQGEHGQSRPLGSDNLRGNATSFYFTNFPEHENESSLWKTFKVLGEVVDLYIARKRNGWGKRFGFVRFLKVRNLSELEKNINGIWIGSFRIHANIARFGRSKRKEVSKVEIKHPDGLLAKHSGKVLERRHSYAEVVKRGVNVIQSTAINSVELSSMPELLPELESSLIGELVSYDALKLVGTFHRLEGWPVCRAFYLGGLSIQLVFDCKVAAVEFLEKACVSWKVWFSTLSTWDPSFLPSSRVARLVIQGVPLHAWCATSFEKIGGCWGKVINSIHSIGNGLSKVYGVVDVLTSKQELIRGTIDVKLKNKIFPVRVWERDWDGPELGEILDDRSAMDSQSEGIDSSWEGDYKEDYFSSPPSNSGVDPAGTVDGVAIGVATGVAGESSLCPVNLGKETFAQFPNSDRESLGTEKKKSFAGAAHVEDEVTPLDCEAVKPWSSPQVFQKSVGSDPVVRDSSKESGPIPHARLGPINLVDNEDQLQPTSSTSPCLDKVDVFPPSQVDNPFTEEDLGVKSFVEDSFINSMEEELGLNFENSYERGTAFVSNRDDQTSSDSEAKIERSSRRLKKIDAGHSFGPSLPVISRSQELDGLLKVGKAIVLSWNLNGLGKGEKRLWINDTVMQRNIGILCLQETKTSVQQEWQISSIWRGKSVGFVSLDAIGNSAGILTVWDTNLFDVSDSCKQEGFVAVWGVWKEKQIPLGGINVYAPQCVSSRRSLWHAIQWVVRTNGDSAWIVCGDFNEVRFPEERLGSVFDSLGARSFNDFIFSTGLTDLNLGGRKYTWMKADLSGSLAYCILVCLPRLLSDHCPILMETGNPDFGPVPFKWFNSWLMDKELDVIIRKNWEEDRPEFLVFSKLERLSRKLRHIKKAVKDWRLGVKQVSNEDLKEINRKISAIDFLAEHGGFDIEMIKEKGELMAKAKDLYSAKLSDLKQKAKSKWVLEGDENTRYFHGVINKKYKRNRIHGVNINGRWNSSPESVKEAAFSYFKDKFQEPHPTRPALNSSLFKKLSDAQSAQLELPFDGQEIKKAVWNCGCNKAPGPDGFTFEFIRRFWDVVGSDFIEAVSFFGSNQLLNPGSNSSFITLIPKVRDPLSFIDYRPINLIGCISKVISKVLAERIKIVMDSVISNSQSAFITGRSILDGPLIVNEVISWAKKMRKKILIFKADFAKAFDSLNWNFLDNVLLQMGFGLRWRSWVKGLTRTTKCSVLINGVPSREFRMEKGIRQGDPLAPFLFILAAEGLSIVFREAQRSNIFKGIRPGNLQEELSLLQFADDAIIMGEWEPENAKNLIRILKCFELCSGLRINLSKSSLMGVSVPKEEVQKVAHWLNCKKGSIPFTYLGLPVGDNMAKASAWKPIIDKFKSRLSLWKAKHLSAGGRLCLIKSVLGGLGNYFFSLYKAPNKVLSSLESIRRRFFWGEVNQSRKINWVVWNKVLRDKKSGGLGIGSLKALNLAMLSKWHWREKVEPNAKWKHVISAISGSFNGSRIGVWKSIQRIDRELEAWGINLQNLIIPNEDNRGWSWQLDDNGEFSVRSLRKFIDCLILPSADSETIWVKGVTSKANVHLWRVMNNRLPTMDNLIKRGVLVNSDGCKFCISNQESADHVARSISDLWESIDSGSSGSLDRMIRRTIGAAFFWVLWNQRNNKTFSGAVKKEREIAEDIKFLAYDWIRGRVKAGKCLIWENWWCNPLVALSSCMALASR
ncbi:hypothetical protein OSB04_001508 [Centaurea solstitialis]|uniref:Uncharacterized protein n=1 Tax=Centaurea solstitialis TaxID=347529 RepID=A0AA38U9A6_9ASTR|nr:hypothetical protein OSB04_001508 [Centaurea solstitialis]